MRLFTRWVLRVEGILMLTSAASALLPLLQYLFLFLARAKASPTVTFKSDNFVPVRLPAKERPARFFNIEPCFVVLGLLWDC